MGIGYDVWILNGKKYWETGENHIYRCVASTTERFQRASPALREFLRPYQEGAAGCSEDDGYRMNPREYAPFISLFQKEKKRMEKRGETERGKDLGPNTITLYDVVLGLYQGLKRAQQAGLPVLVE